LELESYEIGIEPLFHQFNLEPRNFEPEQLRNMKSSRQSTVNRAWFPCWSMGTRRKITASGDCPNLLRSYENSIQLIRISGVLSFRLGTKL
jgi:hypothetical protein